METLCAVPPLIAWWIFRGALHGKLIRTDVQARALPHSLSSCVGWLDLTFHVMQISEALLASDLEFDPPVQDEGEGKQRGERLGAVPEARTRGAAVWLV